MTTAAESEILTRVGPGTPMGELMRQYWIPVLMSSELAPDGATLRLKLLGEQLIAFRDTSGRVGIMDQKCPHRCASLFFGRNEHDGLRCVYHWLEVRRGRQLCRRAEPAGSAGHAQPHQGKGLQRSGTGGTHLGLFGA